MNQLFQQFTAFFEKHEWSFHHDGSTPVLHTHFIGQSGRWEAIAIARAEIEAISFLSLFPSRAPKNRRAACAELMTRLNFGLRHGSFQMDMEDGEIRFAMSLLAPAREVTMEVVERLVFINVGTMDDWYDTIMKVVHGGVAPKLAFTGKRARERKSPAQKTVSPKPRFEIN